MKGPAIVLAVALAFGCATTDGGRSSLEQCYLAAAAGTSTIEEAATFLRSPQGQALDEDTRDRVRLAMVALDAALDAATPICLLPEDGSGRLQAQILAVQTAQVSLANLLLTIQGGR